VSLQCCSRGIEASYHSCFISFRAFEAFANDYGTFGPQQNNGGKEPHWP